MKYKKHTIRFFWKCLTHVYCRVGKNLKNGNLNLIKKFEVFWGLASKNLNILNLSYPENLILNPRNAVFILTLNFEVLFVDSQKTLGGNQNLSKQEGMGEGSILLFSLQGTSVYKSKYIVLTPFV